jgi:predicted GNAT family acetyltransferase
VSDATTTVFTDPSGSPVVRNNRQAMHYEIDVDGALAGFAAYVIQHDRIVFTHTEIDDAFEGKGIGSVLARAALDDARASGRRIVPRCPFIAAYIERHAEYADLVDAT